MGVPKLMSINDAAFSLVGWQLTHTSSSKCTKSWNILFLVKMQWAQGLNKLESQQVQRYDCIILEKATEPPLIKKS